MSQAMKLALDVVLRLQFQPLLVRLGMIAIIISALLVIGPKAGLFSRDSPLYLIAVVPMAILGIAVQLYFWAGVHVFFCRTLVKREEVPVLGIRRLTPDAGSLLAIGFILVILAAAVMLVWQFLIQRVLGLLAAHRAGIVSIQLLANCMALALFRGASLFCVAMMFVNGCRAKSAITKGFRFLRSHYTRAIPVFVLVFCSACLGQYVSYSNKAEPIVAIALGLSMTVAIMAIDLIAAARCYLVIREVRDEGMGGGRHREHPRER